MDYSLLFSIEYNPKYIEMFPEEFERNNDGEVEFPIVQTADEMERSNVAYNKQKKKQLSEDFLRQMAGQPDSDEHLLQRLDALKHQKLVNEYEPDYSINRD